MVKEKITKIVVNLKVMEDVHDVDRGEGEDGH